MINVRANVVMTEGRPDEWFAKIKAVDRPPAGSRSLEERDRDRAVQNVVEQNMAFKPDDIVCINPNRRSRKQYPGTKLRVVRVRHMSMGSESAVFVDALWIDGRFANSPMEYTFSLPDDLYLYERPLSTAGEHVVSLKAGGPIPSGCRVTVCQDGTVKVAPDGVGVGTTTTQAGVGDLVTVRMD